MDRRIPLPPPQTVPETPHIVDIPSENNLADWLTNNPDGTINVPAGGSLDAGGLRFTCSSNGDDCSVRVTLVENSITVTSAGGMATATIVPTPLEPTRSLGGQPTTQQSRLTIPRRNGSFDMSVVLHGLNSALFPVFENGRIVQKKLVAKDAVNNVVPVPDFSKFRIQDGKTKDFGRVRFSCKGAGCEVLVLNTVERGFEVRYEGNVTATLLPFDLLPIDTDKMWHGVWDILDYCLKDSPSDCTLAFPSHFSRSIRSKEILVTSGLQHILTEDRNTQIASNYGWQGKLYANNSDGNPRGDKRRSIEMVIYTNADGPEDLDYLSYGRSMSISGDESRWSLAGVYAKSSASTYGLGQLTGNVTYRGGATGWYAFTGDDADAGHFTASATLNANLGTALEISGTIDQFVDEDGRSQNWKIDLKSRNFNNRSDANVTSLRDTVVWTIDGTPSAAGRNWEIRAADNGNSIIGKFQAQYGTEGRLSGALGTERD